MYMVHRDPYDRAVCMSLAHRGGDLGWTGGTVPPKFEVGGRSMHWSPQYFEK